MPGSSEKPLKLDTEQEIQEAMSSEKNAMADAATDDLMKKLASAQTNVELEEKRAKQRMADEYDQPLPVVNDSPIIQELVMDDVQERLEVGIKRYGTGLQAGNGRNMLRDAYEEALDLTTYLRGQIEAQRNISVAIEALLSVYYRDGVSSSEISKAISGLADVARSHGLL